MENVKLNEQQELAMREIKGAVLVTAGAGSGKTRLLTQRIAYLIKENNVDPYNILAITFTNKATNEMKTRVADIIGENSPIWISTIHGMCAKILRSGINLLGGNYNQNFSIYNADDSLKLIKQIVSNNTSKDKKDDEEDSKKDDPIIKQIANHLSNMKNQDVSIAQYKLNNAFISDIDKITNYMQQYADALKSNNAVDFDDLIVLTLKLLREQEEVRNYYLDRFQYILVDEFQDTSTIQYGLIKLLASKHKNIFAVGDEDQCIYGWRGANIKNIQNFIKDFDGCKIFKLEENYRSTKNILNLANKLISNNQERIVKNLFTSNGDGEPVYYRCFDKDKDEAEFVAQQIYMLHKQGYEYKDMAVLMRLNALSRKFEDDFLKYNIPYHIYGGIKFYDRLEIKNMLSYLKIISNPFDNTSFISAMNFPKRGIGAVTLSKMLETANNYNLSLYELCSNLDLCVGLTANVKAKIKQFYDIILSIKEYEKENSLRDTIDYVFKQSGIKELYKSKTEENMNRTLNVNNLIISAEEFEDSVDSPTLSSYLESITLISDADNGDEESSVSISTVHAVKGLEFKVVFIVGLEQKVFPIIRDDTEIEEERRLMYVAITRAKERLYLTNVNQRYLYSGYDSMIASCFLKELDFVSSHTYDNLAYAPKIKTYGIRDDNYGEYGNNEMRPQFIRNGGGKSFSSYSKTPSYSINNNKATKEGFDVGKRVNHSRYGQGTIIEVSGSGMQKMIIVQFDVVGNKQLLLEFAPVTLI